jgi:hypothetical protein
MEQHSETKGDRRDSRAPDDEGKSGSLLEELGIKEELLPDALAPAVDRRKLQAYVKGELSEEAAKEVDGLVARFGCWREAMALAVFENAR